MWLCASTFSPNSEALGFLPRFSESDPLPGASSVAPAVPGARCRCPVHVRCKNQRKTKVFAVPGAKTKGKTMFLRCPVQKPKENRSVSSDLISGSRGARCPVPGARCPVSGARCPVPGAWCPVPGARCPVSGARCAVCGARCRCPVPNQRFLFPFLFPFHLLFHSFSFDFPFPSP